MPTQRSAQFLTGSEIWLAYFDSMSKHLFGFQVIFKEFLSFLTSTLIRFSDAHEIYPKDILNNSSMVRGWLGVSNQGGLTEVSDVPHGVDGGMTFVEDDEERRAGDTFCQILTVQILPAQTKKSFESLSHDTVS